MDGTPRLGRRALVAGLAASPLSARAAEPTEERRRTLVLGLDIGDTVTFDPARQVDYTPPLTVAACYDTLVTYGPGQYHAVAPALAEFWERTPEGDGWRFTLRGDALFASGQRVTPEDVAFSLTRLLAIGAPPGHFLDNIAAVSASGADSVDILLHDRDRPLLGYLAAPCCAVLERAVLERHDGTDQSNAATADQASAWLSQNSAGSGDYVLTSWRRRDRIQLEASRHAWRGAPGYDRVLIRHMPDSTAQLRALQRGDVDVAFNLAPAQFDQLQADPALRVETTQSLDMVYLALTGDSSRSPALAQRPARQAVGYAIDYDDLIGRLLGGKAVRPASFLPVGLAGSAADTAASIGFRQDLPAARALLAEAGLADGFTFDLAYADVAIAGLGYDAVAKKLRADLGRVGITVRLAAMDPYAFRDAYLGGRLQAALGFWTSPVVAPGFWARSALDRLGPRLGAAPPAALSALVGRAETEADPAAQAGLWLDYQRAMVSLAHEIVLFQPDYQVGVRRSVASFPLTAAGWMADLAGASPAAGRG